MSTYVPRDKVIEDYLKSKTIIEESTNCWRIKGYDDGKDGHQKIRLNGKNYFAHRISAWLYLEFDLNSPLLILHKIECKNKDCWNPKHIYIGTHSDNVQDSIKMGTHIAPSKFKTHCNQGHLLDGLRSNGKRYCKTCNRIRTNSNLIVSKLI